MEQDIAEQRKGGKEGKGEGKGKGKRGKGKKKGKRGAWKLASYWYNTGTSVDAIPKEGDDYGMNIAWGTLEKRSMDHTLNHLWMEFVVYGEFMEDLTIV